MDNNNNYYYNQSPVPDAQGVQPPIPPVPQQTAPQQPVFVMPEAAMQQQPVQPVGQPMPAAYQQGYAANYQQPSAAPVAPRKSRLPIVIGVLVALLLVVVGGVFGIYASAISQFEAGNYSAARTRFELLGSLLSSDEKVLECDYCRAGQRIADGRYGEAAKLFDALAAVGYKDSAAMAQEARYLRAGQLCESGDYGLAYKLYSELAKDGYKDSSAQSLDSFLLFAVQRYQDGEYVEVMRMLESLADSNDIARLYYSMASLRDYQQNYSSLYSAFELLEETYALASEYVQLNDDAAELCDDPIFFVARMFGAEWECGRYALSCEASDDSSTISFDLPWADPEGTRWDVLVHEDGAVFYDGNNNWWFTINGFSDPTAFHGGKMYITGSNGIKYTFVYVGLLD